MPGSVYQPSDNLAYVYKRSIPPPYPYPRHDLCARYRYNLNAKNSFDLCIRIPDITFIHVIPRLETKAVNIRGCVED